MLAVYSSFRIVLHSVPRFLSSLNSTRVKHRRHESVQVGATISLCHSPSLYRHPIIAGPMTGHRTGNEAASRCYVLLISQFSLPQPSITVTPGSPGPPFSVTPSDQVSAVVRLPIIEWPGSGRQARRQEQGRP
eukprot:752166-Hanusia_phi.AAC.1